jgi:hypothetical protein
MFARVLECQAKDGRGVQISVKVTNDVLPVLQVLPGFVDFFAVSDKTNAEKLMCISFWTLGNAEEFHQEYYETVTDMLEAVLECPPTLRTFATEELYD